MIDRDQLTEALALLADGDLLREVDRHNAAAYVEAVAVSVKAARLLLDFPTDEMVEAAAKVHAVDTRAVLEAVRRVMYGENPRSTVSNRPARDS